MRIFTRREKIRHLKRVRFLSKPDRAAERLRPEGFISQTTVSPYQYRYIYHANDVISFGEAIALGRFGERLIRCKHLYLAPTIRVQHDGIIRNFYHEEGLPLVCALGVEGERWRVYGRGRCQSSAEGDAYKNLLYRVGLGSKWRGRLFRVRKAYEQLYRELNQ